MGMSLPNHLPRRYAVSIALCIFLVPLTIVVVTFNPYLGQRAALLPNIKEYIESHGRTPLATSAMPSRPAPAPSGSPQSPRCANLFDSGYIREFSKTQASYCEVHATPGLSCFNYKAMDQRKDSFCLGNYATFDSERSSIQLSCYPRDGGQGDRRSKEPRLSQFSSYWYDTGPRTVFRDFVNFTQSANDNAHSGNDTKALSLLVKREDNNNNMWHTMLEIMSLTLSLDILKEAKNPQTNESFLDKDDIIKSQVVILDDLPKGPWYDLWRMNGGGPPVRFSDSGLGSNNTSRILVPLPGGSNPFWSGDWVDLECGESEYLQTFVGRILGFYRVKHANSKSRKPFTLTMIDRKQKRRLLGQDSYFTALQERHPNVKMRLVDYAALSFREQLEVSASTDILVGVHGAGLTHGMFLPKTSAIVEILPPELKHKGFYNMAKFLGHQHFSRHGVKHDSPDNSGDWQHDDVQLAKGDFLEVVGQAIANLAEAVE